MIYLDQRCNDHRAEEVSTRTEVKVKLGCEWEIQFRGQSCRTAEQIMKALLQQRQYSDLICDLRLSTQLEQRGTFAKLQRRAHQRTERLLHCQRF